MKSGMQMMFESMIGAEGAKAIEEVKRILPSVPQLIQNMKTEWENQRATLDEMRADIRLTRQLFERIATQNNLILGKLDALKLKVDPSATTEEPPELMRQLDAGGTVIADVTTTLAEQGASLCSECGALFCEHRVAIAH